MVSFYHLIEKYLTSNLSQVFMKIYYGTVSKLLFTSILSEELYLILHMLKHLQFEPFAENLIKRSSNQKTHLHDLYQLIAAKCKIMGREGAAPSHTTTLGLPPHV
jgi:hypothetical protein